MRKSFVALTLAAVLALTSVPAFAATGDVKDGELTKTETTTETVSPSSVSPENLVKPYDGISDNTLSMNTAELAKKAAQRFTDVDADKYFAANVEWAVEHGIVAGTTATTFEPYKTCARDMIVAFLYRSQGSPKVSQNSVFTDVTSYWATDAINWGAAKGVVAGTSKTTFSPKQGCTRAQAVTFLWRLAGKPAYTKEATFSDMNKTKVSDYKKAISWAAERGIVAGKTDGSFGVYEACNRADIVCFITRAIANGAITVAQ